MSAERLRPHTEAMGELAILAVAGVGTALATGLGAIPVFALGERATAATGLVGAGRRPHGRGVRRRPAPARVAGGQYGRRLGGLLAGVAF